MRNYMKILLVSNGKFLIEEGYKLLGIPKDKIRIGYITTASKGARSLDYLKRHIQEMARAGYSYEEFDIEGKTQEEILKFFSDKNVIHVEGGNTFYLLKAIRESGFKEALKILLDKGLVYVGTSAGAYVMCPDIEVATWSDRNRFGVEDLTGLNYVPYYLKAHYTDEMEKDIREKAQNLRHPLRILRDGQGIYVENDENRFVGEGEEIHIKLEKNNDGPNKKTFEIH